MSAEGTSLASLELERHFAVAPERLFDAWLQPSWCEWLPPGGATCRILAMSPKTGGSFRLEMTMPDGRTMAFSGRYLTIDRPRTIVLTWTGSLDQVESVITVQFRPTEGGTLMTLSQRGFAEAALRNGYKDGWSGPGGTFDKLANLLLGSGR